MFTKQHHKIYTFTVVVEKDDDGYYVYAPQLPGCHTQGDTYAGAMTNIKEAMQGYLEDMMEKGEEIPTEKDTVVSLNKVQLSF
ncbi:MAG: type II toxin-antitoxin system HicB family antitoxin [Candidatus Doudnabacteria bacterium]|nr:type II toxin-antitoxin system HicB family antitoxin [Candidatus Doudnabacteria bacterium]